MSRLFQLEVFSPVEIVEPTSFFADVESVGLDIMGRDYDLLLRYEGGVTTTSRENGLIVDSKNKLRYPYISLVAPYVGHRTLELVQDASLLFAESRLPGSIGGTDIISEVSAVLSEDDQGFCETFHYISVESSARFPGQAILALRQLEGDKRLERARQAIEAIIATYPPRVFSDEKAQELLSQHSISGSIPFARTKTANPNTEQLQEVVQALTANTLYKNVHVRFRKSDYSIGQK